MRKALTLLCCCLISGHCFTQTKKNEDTVASTPVLVYISKKSIQNSLIPELAIYPNPANNKITLQVKNFNPGMVSVKVLDIKGKTMREDNRLLTNGTEDITMFLMLKGGIYFIMVTEQGKTARKKLVVL